MSCRARSAPAGRETGAPTGSAGARDCWWGSAQRLQDRHVVGDRRATHVEDRTEVGLRQLHGAGLAGELHRRDGVHRNSGCADWVTLRLEAAGGIDRQFAVFRGPASSTARAPCPGAVSPIASYSSSSAMVKQSCDSTKDRSMSLVSAAASACFQAWAAPSNCVTSRLLIGRKSLTWTAALKRTALPMALAVSSSVMISAAAPSETREQSVRFSGGAT